MDQLKNMIYSQSISKQARLRYKKFADALLKPTSDTNTIDKQFESALKFIEENYGIDISNLQNISDYDKEYVFLHYLNY